MRGFTETLLRLIALLGLIAFWCGMAAAAHAYPAAYDWRYQTISVLLYPDQNPHGYFWAWVGLELCGLSGIAWTAGMTRPSNEATGRAMKSLRLLQAGFVCMCCAVLPDRMLPVPKGHEILAIAAFLAICIGVVREMLLTRHRLWGESDQSTVSRFGTLIPAGAPLLPLLIAGMTQTYLALERPNVPWVTPAWRTLGIPIYLSFAVWEWVSCVLFSACLLLLLWALRMNETGEPKASSG